VLQTGERYSICGQFAIGKAGQWRALPDSQQTYEQPQLAGVDPQGRKVEFVSAAQHAVPRKPAAGGCSQVRSSNTVKFEMMHCWARMSDSHSCVLWLLPLPVVCRTAHVITYSIHILRVGGAECRRITCSRWQG
jgi:hypothetical protein